MVGMRTEEKIMVRERQQQKQQASLECSLSRSKKGRGRKRRSPQPPPPLSAPLSFFKVLIGNFRDVLFIPPMAACTIKNLAKKYVRIEDSDGNYWNVKMSMVDGSLAFQSGWHHFVIAHSIKVGEFLLFTYKGELLFTARIFGTNSLERVSFQLKKSRSKCKKGRFIAESKTDKVRFSKKQKTCQASEDKLSSPNVENQLSLKKIKKSSTCKLPKVHVNEGDSIPVGVLEVPSAGENSHHHDSNSKGLDSALIHDSEQTLHKVNDATVDEELNIKSPTELAKSDAENLKVVPSESIENRTSTIEQGVVGLHIGRTLLPTREAGKLDAMTKTVSTWAINAHSDIEEESRGMNGFHVQADKVDAKLGNNGKIEQNSSYDLEMLDIEPLRERMLAAASKLKHAKCCPKLEVNLFEPEELANKVFCTADGICRNVDEKSSELATGTGLDVHGKEDSICQNDQVTFCSETSVQCENIPAVPSTPKLDCNKDKKENLMRKREEYGNPKDKGIARDYSSGWRSQAKIERTDSVDFPSSTCVKFSICLSYDIESSLELPENLSCKLGKMKNERKVVLLQNLYMKCWPVLYHESINFIGFLGGWLDFVRANNICGGEICEFELVNKNEFIFRVHIRKS